MKIITSRQADLPAAPADRGYHVAYRADRVNHCPGCGRSHWIIGRFSAECGFCGTAVLLADAGMTGAGLIRRASFEEAA